MHLPLSIHRFARQAARAAECAAEGNRAPKALIDLLYANQDSFGLKSWGVIAAQAGVSDTESFVKCVRGTRPIARIDSGVAIAKRFGVLGTPGIMSNGWRFQAPPSETALVSTARLLLANDNRLPDVAKPKSR